MLWNLVLLFSAVILLFQTHHPCHAVAANNIIFCDGEQRFKLIDLGACADLRNGTNYIPDESILDFHYCPPEQVNINGFPIFVGFRVIWMKLALQHTYCTPHKHLSQRSILLLCEKCLCLLCWKLEDNSTTQAECCELRTYSLNVSLGQGRQYLYLCTWACAVKSLSSQAHHISSMHVIFLQCMWQPPCNTFNSIHQHSTTQNTRSLCSCGSPCWVRITVWTNPSEHNKHWLRQNLHQTQDIDQQIDLNFGKVYPLVLQQSFVAIRWQCWLVCPPFVLCNDPPLFMACPVCAPNWQSSAQQAVLQDGHQPSDVGQT